MPYNYIVKPRALQKIRTFYVNVARKYRHTFSYEDLEKNVHDAFFAIYEIEKTLPRRQPSQKRWQGCYMTNTTRWYYCYRIEGNDIIVTDACHAQNMKTPIDSIHQ